MIVGFSDDPCSCGPLLLTDWTCVVDAGPAIAVPARLNQFQALPALFEGKELDTLSVDNDAGVEFGFAMYPLTSEFMAFSESISSGLLGIADICEWGSGLLSVGR